MAIADLLKKTIKHNVTRSMGAGEEVEYRHIKPLLKETVRCMPEYGEFNDIQDEDIASLVIFHSLHLATKPKTADYIGWDGEDYIVEKFKKVGDGYDVTAVIKKHKRGGRR